MLVIAGLTGPVNAQEGSVLPLKWEAVDKPGERGEIVVFPSEINRIANSGDVVYAVDTANSKLHRSGNGGLTFTDITSAFANTGVTLPIREIAVAPGMPQYLAVSDNVSRVYWSNDSGATWNDTSFPSISAPEAIQCIAISNGYLGDGSILYHDLAVGTAAWGDSTIAGKVWTIKVGTSYAGWQLQDSPLLATTAADISAIAFSPNYSKDFTILCIASTAADLGTVSDNKTFLSIGFRDLSLQTTNWIGTAGYPVQIDSSGDAAGVTGIVSRIALPSDYSGDKDMSRKVFVSYYRTDNVTANNVYRIDDYPRLVQTLFQAYDNISSIAYYGTLKSGKLLAGEVYKSTDPAEQKMVQVWRTLTPLGSPIGSPGTTTWTRSSQPPSGPGNAQVAWNSRGTVAFCGTGQLPGEPLDESAFSRSSDNGDNWVQTSLINTIIRMCDIAPAPDSRSLFMATFSAGGTAEGVWRSAGEPIGTYWSRLLTMRTSSDMVLLRLSPDYSNDDTIYAVEADSDNRTLMSVSENRGNTWKRRYVQGPVIDMVASGKYTLYMALPGGCIRKSTDGGLRWGNSVMTGLDNINMLTLASNGHLFAGSMDSQVAYSTDNGSSFIEIPDPIAEVLGTGYVQVAADANYQSNSIIYAADNITGKGVWRRTIGQSTEWEQIDEAITEQQPQQRISGLMTGPEGTLYALRAERPKPYRASLADNNTGGMNRTLNPASFYPVNIEWDIVNRTLTDDRVAFDPEPLKFINNPPWLKLSGNSGENELWTIDTANVAAKDDTAQIFRFRDTLCKVGPWTDGPTEVGCDPVSGRNQGFGLLWEQLSLSDRYGLQVAKDPAFTLKVDPAISNSENVSAVTGSIYIKTDPDNVLSPALLLNPASLPEAGADYYWRVRTVRAATWEKIRSPWSGTAHFFVKPGFPVTTSYYGAQSPPPDDGRSGGVQSAKQSAQATAQRNGAAPLWAWIMIAVGILTVFFLSVMLLRRSRVL